MHRKIRLFSSGKIWQVSIKCYVYVPLLEDSIPVGCISLTSKLYVLQFQLPPLDVTLGGVGPKMNMFEQVSSDHDQMSLAVGGRSPGLMSRGGRYPGLMSRGYPTT